MKRSTRNGLLGVVGTWFAIGLFCTIGLVFSAGGLTILFAVLFSFAIFILFGGFDD